MQILPATMQMKQNLKNQIKNNKMVCGMKNEYKRYFLQDWQIFDAFDLPKYFCVKGDLDLSDMELTKLPDLSTVMIMGRFDCSHNNLTNLAGGPVAASVYDCSYNQLKTLRYAPKKVDVFDCAGNKLISLADGPQYANVYDCCYNNLVSLYGAPAFAQYFCCSYNLLTRLTHGPLRTGIYDCSHNRLRTLRGMPHTAVEFDCSYNDSLKFKRIPMGIKQLINNQHIR